ncbi:ABC transporter ATP-binding protein [Thalassospira povalilytica]|uniref:ABC transporter ATP-binding protein n=1 Tax=Thalassospira povalilytica TaxID=732237 RepID=A0A8I1M8B8_9PROT|nr:ABC transporter ATP-binding protein [Thalassospira povalilytica]MBN8197225.1 ABC transporter ATP-binding protein [Thalassospira povalilytica]
MTDGLKMSNVSHMFGKNRVLRDISFDVAPGELVCLLGPSGCGKTTALRLAAGLEKLQVGEISVSDQVVARPGEYVEPEKRGVGMVFQDYALFPHLNVAKNIAFGLRHFSEQDRSVAVKRALDQVGMSDYEHAFPHELSGGQQQRIALARALAPTPRIMLLDEPFSGLDVARRADLRDTTLHVLKNAGIATVMVTHDPQEAMYMADRIIIMNEGQIMQDGTPETLYFRPESRFVASFFGEVNHFPSVVANGSVKTPVGVLDDVGLADGTDVDVLIRPEGLHIGDAVNGHDILANVDAVRALGEVNLMHLTLHSGGHIHARVPRRFSTLNQKSVAITLDPEMTFVFPMS